MIIVILGFIVVLVIGGIILWKFCLSTERGHVQDNQQKPIEMKLLTKTSNIKNIYTQQAKSALQSQSYTTSYQIKNETTINTEQCHDQYANKNNQELDKQKNREQKTQLVTKTQQKVEEEQLTYQKTQYEISQKREEQKYQQKSDQQTQQIMKQVTSQYKEEKKESFETLKQQPKQSTKSQAINRNDNNIIPKLTEITVQQIIEIDKRVIFLIGQGGIGKTQIFYDICKYQNLEIKQISKKNFHLIEFENYILIDTPKFELNDDIDIREQTIEQFSPIFNDLLPQISAFVIVCKFERTDIMKRNIMENYKFLQKQKHYISLLITDFHLSENKEADMSELNQKFQLFISNPKQTQERIIYFDKSMKNKNLQNTIEAFDLLAKDKITQPFSDTIFENIQSEKYQLEMQNIQSQLVQSFQNFQNPKVIQTY